jgi:hypothetical protein
MQAIADRSNLNFKPHWKLFQTTLEIGSDPCFSVRRSSPFPSKPVRSFGQKSAMLESPILDVVTLLVIAAVL